MFKSYVASNFLEFCLLSASSLMVQEKPKDRHANAAKNNKLFMDDRNVLNFIGLILVLKRCKCPKDIHID